MPRGVGGGRADDAGIVVLSAERAAAKLVRNFSEADRIRDALADLGVVLKDSAAGTTWERSP